MNRVLEKVSAALLGFGFSAVWVVAGPASAFGCLLVAAGAYGAVALVQKRRLDRFTDEFMHGVSARRRQPRERGSTGARPRRTAAPEHY